MEDKIPKNWIVSDLLSLSEISTGKKDANHATIDGKYPFYTCALTQSKSDTYAFDGPSVIIPGNGNIGYVFYYDNKFEAYQRTYIINKIKINPRFLYYHFQCYWKSRTVDNLFGSTIQYVKIGNFKDYKVQFPCLAEQQRIVAKLDELFRHLEQVENRFDSLRNIGDKYLNSCIINSSENKFYSRKKIGQFLEEGTSRIGDKWEGLRLIGVSAKEGIINLRIGQKKTFEKYKIVQPGDFIYNTMRVNIGSIAIYEGDEIALTSPDYVVFRVKEYLSSKLLFRFLKSTQGLLEIGANTKGSVRARLYFSALSEIRMPIAPESIQLSAQRFLKEFDTSLKSLDNLKRNKLDKLPQAILAKAFKGELVPQLPSDGDAKELLAEIKKLKAKVGRSKTVVEKK